MCAKRLWIRKKSFREGPFYSELLITQLLSHANENILAFNTIMFDFQNFNILF